METQTEDSTFELTTGLDNVTGTSGNDIFVGTYNDAGSGTFNNTDVLNGNGGTDTLNITPIGVAAITPADAYWTGITGIEKIVIDTTGAGAQPVLAHKPLPQVLRLKQHSRRKV